LLLAIIRQYLDGIVENLETVCQTLHGRNIEDIATELATGYLDIKIPRRETSRALKMVISDLDADVLASETEKRMTGVICKLLRTAPDAEFENVEDTAFILQSALTGSTRALLALYPPTEVEESVRSQLTMMCKAYLRAANTLAQPG
jgi:hypothetical protein